MDRREVIDKIKIRFDSLKNELKNEIHDLQLSLQQETKSSMGDKYETQREMIQQEITRTQEQLANLENQIFVSELNPNYQYIQNGNIVNLVFNKLNISIFIGVSIGDLKIENKVTIKTVSPSSPLGKLLVGKQKGDKIILNNNLYFIQDCY